MKILLVTQKVDINDSTLGFFHRWVEEFANHFEKVTLICLGKGKYNLPGNVRVLSLGKERKVSRFAYVSNFYRYIWHERNNYDVVFVHMNQEYVILAGIFWRLMGKKILLWRNHPQGTFLTNIAVTLSDTVFCTSPTAYTARFKKTIRMPAGIDTEMFRPQSSEKLKDSIVCLGRISPVKKLEVIIEGIKELAETQWTGRADIYGEVTERDKPYAKKIRALSEQLEKEGKISFFGALPHHEILNIYNKHELYINATPSGSFDKTIFEAMSCEMLVLVSNKGLIGAIPNECIFIEDGSVDLAEKMKNLFSLSEDRKNQIRKELRAYVVREQSLSGLMSKMISVVNNKN